MRARAFKKKIKKWGGGEGGMHVCMCVSMGKGEAGGRRGNYDHFHIALFSILEQTHCAFVASDSK